jgi:HAMP domain-containing protein
MRSLYLRIYLTVVAALALFALVSGWLVQRHLEDQRVRAEGAVRDRVEAWGELLQRSLPPAEASADEQVAGVRDWSQRLRVPMALDDAAGKRLGASDSFMRRMAELPAFGSRLQPIRFDDGRTLWVPRLNPARLNSGARPPPPDSRPPWLVPRSWPDGVGLAALLVVLFLAVAGGAFPVVRRLTRRLESLKQGVEAFGAGALHQRVAEDGQDEVAAVGASFNRAATRIEALVRSHQSLLANASHELRSPLARLKMAVQMLEDAAPAQRPRCGARSTPTSPSWTPWWRKCCWPGGWMPAPRWSTATVWTCWACWPKKPPASAPRCKARTCSCRGTSGCCAVPCATCWRTPGATAAPRSRPASKAAASGPGAGVRPRPRRAGGLSRAHLRGLLPPARPCRAGRGCRPGSVAGAPDRRAPWRPCALRAP